MPIVLAPTQIGYVWRELADVELVLVDRLALQLVARITSSVPQMLIVLWQQMELLLTAIASQDSQGQSAVMLSPPRAIPKVVLEKFTLLATTREDVFALLDSVEMTATQIKQQPLVISPSPSLVLLQPMDHSLQIK
jgi:hypothetical protein